MPIIYLWPSKLLNIILNKCTDMPLFEYYFEPINNEGFVFLQFMHNNFEKGCRQKILLNYYFLSHKLFLL